MTVCEFNAINKSFGKNHILKDISFKIPEKSFVPLIGPNGAGKTTTMKLILGELAPDDGKILFFGKPPCRKILKNIGYVPEHLEFPNVSVQTLLKYISSLKDVSYHESKRKIIELSKWFGMESKLAQPIDKLSAGMKQKVRIIQALINDPPLLILDEPTRNLDIFSREKLFRKLTELNRKKEMTILYSTHIISELEDNYNYIILMKDGRIVHKGPTSNLSTDKHTKEFQLETDNLEKTIKILESYESQLEISSFKENRSLLIRFKNPQENHLLILKQIFTQLCDNYVTILSFSSINSLKTSIMTKLQG